MDDFTAEMIASGESNDIQVAQQAAPTQRHRDYFGRSVATPVINVATDRDSMPSPDIPADGGGGGKPRMGIRGRITALKDKANIQDRLVEKLLQHVIPEEDNEDDDLENLDTTIDVDDVLANRPNFNITTMSNNFRRFNARIGVIFRFQVRMIRLFGWRKYSHTLSFLAVYTFVCLDPYLLVLLPLAGLLLGVLIPSFMARHPPLSPHYEGPSSQILQAQQYSAASMEYSPRGPPLAPARTVKPVKELSKDFFRNMRDLQNSMEDFSVGHDSIIALVVPTTNFSDEALSSALFLFLFMSFLLLTIAAHLIPWRLAALAAGWGAVLSGHPGAKRMLAAATREHVEPHTVSQAQSAMRKFAQGDVVLDVAPETREVEIFELQHRSSENNEWEPWFFTSNPYDPLSASRISGERPRGTRFFEDVHPPDDWDWSEKKWALDLWSRDWVEERIITAVEVETEGERWVYDMLSSYDAQGKEGEPVIHHSTEKVKSSFGGPSWEEGFEGDGVGRRGEWRRRRWVRLVKRKSLGVV